MPPHRTSAQHNALNLAISAAISDKEQELDTVSVEDVSTLLMGCDKISLQLCEIIAKYMDSVDYPKEETLNEIR